MSVIGAILTCQRCACHGIYAGPLAVGDEDECGECRHSLLRDHTLTVDGVVDATKQFRRKATPSRGRQ